MSLSDAWHLLKRKWLVILLVPLALSLSTYFFARHMPKTYSSYTTIYTGIASGYSLKGDAAADYSTTSNAFDNLVNLITARTTKEEVIYQLIANHLRDVRQRPELLGAPAYENLRDGLAPDLRQQLTKSSPEETLAAVRQYARANTTNTLYGLLNSDNPTYSLTALGRLSASRIASSDLVRLEFESYNPQICQTTLTLLTQVFLAESRNLREGQTASVIEFYEEEMSKVKARLAKAESTYLAFNRENNIINYDQQAKGITEEKDAVTAEVTQLSQQYAGALAALQAINKRLGGRQEALRNSNLLLEQRQKLGRLNAAIADQQVLKQSGEEQPAKVKQLQEEARKLTEEMQNSVDKYYANNNSVQGIPSKELLAEWVQDMSLVETNRAKLRVMYRRQQEFEKEYERMAPLGATTKRIEREIKLAEQDYLSVLTNLNASKAAQQNTQLTANVKILDPPNLPLRPKSNKLLLLVVGSGVGGLVFVLSLVLGLGLLDRSLKNPAVAAKRTGLPVAGLMLDTNAAPTKLLMASRQRSLGQLVRHIMLSASTPPAPVPFVVGIFSVQRQEGKTTLCQALSQRCHEMGMQTLAIYPDDDDEAARADLVAPSLYYPAEMAAVQGWQLEQLIQNALPRHLTESRTPDVQIMLVEFPALREEALPIGLLRQLHLVFLTVPANRAWRLTDHQTVERLRAATSASVEVVLSGVALHHTEYAHSS